MFLSGTLGSGVLGFFILGGIVEPAHLPLLFPNGVSRWIGLFTTLPDSDGLGGVEAAISRLELDTWINVEDSRVSLNDIRFQTDPTTTVEGFGIWDAASGGNLIMFEPLKYQVGEPLVLTFGNGYLLEFPIGDISIDAVLETVLCVLSTGDDHITVLQDLLPYGPAWTRRPGTWLTKLLEGLAREAGRVEARAAALIEEADPRTTQELLDDWLEFVGLPDCGQELPTTLEGKQGAVTAKLTQHIRPTPDTFIQIAENLGYIDPIVRRSESDPFTVGSSVGDSLYGAQWHHTWSITVFDEQDNDGALECLVESLTPQHGTALVQHIDDILWSPIPESLHDPFTEVDGTIDGAVFDSDTGLWTFDGVTNRLDWTGVPEWVLGTELTILGWIVPDSVAAGLHNFFTISDTVPQQSIIFRRSGAALQFAHAYSVTTPLRTSNNVLAAGGLSHVAATYDGSGLGAGINLFHMGEPVDSYTATTNGIGTPRDADGVWSLGGRFDSDAQMFAGEIGRMRVFNRILTQDEIQWLMKLDRP